MKTVGIIGLGNMGLGMALSLNRGGFEALGFDASPVARDRAAAEGIALAGSLAEVARSADVFVLSLPHAAAVTHVVVGASGLLAHACRGSIVIDASTSDPATSQDLASRLRGAGIGFIDAPVSGGPTGARNGSLTISIGGTDEDVARAEPVLQALSAKRVHVGPAGSGNVVKIANNLLVGCHLLISTEITRLAEAAGVSRHKLFEAVNASTGRSVVTEAIFPAFVLKDNFEIGFAIQLMRKDIRLADELARVVGGDFPVAAAVGQQWGRSAATIADDQDALRIVEAGLNARLEAQA